MTRTQYPRLEPDGKLILYHCKIENCAPLLLYIYIFIGKYFTFVPGTLSRKIWQNIDYRPKHKQVIYQYHILKKKNAGTFETHFLGEYLNHELNPDNF